MMGTIAGGAESSIASEGSSVSVTVTQEVLQWRQKHELLEQSIQKYVLFSLPAKLPLTLYRVGTYISTTSLPNTRAANLQGSVGWRKGWISSWLIFGNSGI